MTGGETIVLGAILVGVMFAIRAARGRKRSRDPLTDVREQFEKAERTPSAQIAKAEVRLHDFAREVEGRVQTRMATLDQLIREADREIIRLQDVLARARAERTPDIVVRPPDSRAA